MPSVLRAVTVTIISGDPAGVGFNDPTPTNPVGGNTGTTLGQQRMIAFQTAAGKWAATLNGSVTIRVSAVWTALTCTTNSAVLGMAGATEVFRDFSGAPVAGHWYAKALANQLAGQDLDPSNYDISANFNVNLGASGCLSGIFFYLGLDDNHGSNVDLITVVTHELGHGLGFQTYTNPQTGAQLGNLPSIWDDFLLDNTTNTTWTLMTPAQRVASAVNTGHLVWTGGNLSSAIPQVLQAQGSSFSGADSQGRGLMYSPNPFVSGSSVSHFDTSMFPSQLMEPIYSSSLTHEVTPPHDLTFPLLKDLGWTGSSGAVPAQATLTLPVNGTTGQLTTPTLNWASASGATSYDLYLGTSNPPALYAQSLSGTNFTVSTPLNSSSLYFWNVVAKNSSGSAPASATWSFTTAASVPAQVTLGSPASGAANQSATPTLNWSAASGATSYDLYLGNTNPPAVYAQNLVSTSYTVSTALTAGGTYYWKVVAKNSAGSAPASSIWSFTTAASVPAQVTLASPASGATNQSLTPTLSWSAASNATSYDLYLGTANPPSLYAQNLTSTSFTATTSLAASSTYNWNVVAKNGAGSAPASSTWSFTTGTAPPPPPALRQVATCPVSQPVTCSFPTGVPAGDLIVVIVANGSACTVTSTPSNVFSPAVSTIDSQGIVLGSYYSGPVAAGTNSVRISCTGYPYAAALDISGATALDQTGVANGTSQVTSVTTSGAVTSGTEYVLEAAEISNASPAFVAGTGYTDELPFFANFGTVADKNARTGLSGAQTGTFDSGRVGAVWASLILTFKAGGAVVPTQVTLTSPANGATNQSTTPTLSWAASSNATSYDLYLGTTNPPAVYAQNLTGTSFSVSTALAAGSTYFWNVVAKNGAGSAPASSTSSFTVAGALPTQVTLTAPANGSTNQSTTPTFSWAASTNATSYDLYLGFSNPPPVYAQNLTATSFTVSTALTAGSSYFWSVVAKDSAGSAPASATWAFSIPLPLPTQVTLTSPVTGATNQSATPVFTWAASTNATSYDLYLGTTNPPPLYAQNLPGAGFTVSNALTAGSTYFWNVVAKNNTGSAPVSSTWSFTVVAGLPTQVTLTGPTNGATNQSTTPTFSWAASANATSYDLYLGTTNPPAVYAQSLTSTSFTVSNTLSAGSTYFWNVVAKNTAGSAPASSTWSFTVSAGVPTQVTLTSPVSGATNQSNTPTLSWSAATRATAYDLYLGTTNPPAVFAQNLTSTSFTVSTALTAGGAYFWNVVAKDSAGPAPASSTWSFTVAAGVPTQVTLTSPTSGATNQSATPALSWSPSANATSYDLYLATTNPPTVYAQNLTSTSFMVSTALTAGSTYVWNVVAKNSAGSAPASATWSFTTAAALPAQVTLTSPASGATNQSVTPTLSWSASTNATSYDLYLGTTNPPAIYAQNLAATSYTVSTALGAGTAYYWKVVAKNSAGSAPASAIWPFTTASSGGGGTAPVLNQIATCTGAQPVTCSFFSGVAAGDLILVLVANGSGCTVTSTPSNVFSSAVSTTDAGGIALGSYYSGSAAAGTKSLRISCSGYPYATALDVSGVSMLDQMGAASGNSQVTSVTTSGGVTAGTEYVVAASEVSNAVPSFVAGAGYTNEVRFFANFAQVADKDARTGLSGIQTASFDSGQVGATWASLILTFKSGAAAPAQVTLTSPTTGATNQVTTPTLSWSASTNATSYDLYLGTSNPPPVYAQTLSSTSFVVSTALNSGASYFWSVVAKNSAGSAPASSIWSFTTAAQAPAQVTLVSPANGATSQALTPTLSWTASGGTTAYDVYLGTTNPPALFAQNLSTTTLTVSPALAASTIYFWNVVAKNGAGSAPASATWSFTTGVAAPGQVTLAAPANASTGQSTTPTLSWTASNGATAYDVYLGTTNPPAVFAQNLSGTSLLVSTALNAGGTYFWNVVAKNSGGSAPASATWSFTTTPPVPAQVTLTSPANGAINQSTAPTLTWSASSNATAYDVYLGTSNPPGLFGSVTAGTSLTVSPALNASTTYYWNVIAKNSTGSAPASSTWSFTTAPPAPTQVSLTSPVSGATNQSTTPTLTWSASNNATAYDLYLGTTNPPAMYAQNLSSTSFAVSTALNAGTTYFWQVVAKDISGSAPASAVWSFTTAPPSGGGPPTLRQVGTCSGSQPVTCSFFTPVPAGDLIVVLVANGSACTVTSTPSNVFSASVSTTDSQGITLGSYYSGSVAANTNAIRISCYGYPYAAVLDVSGVSTLDQTGVANATNEFTSVTTSGAVTASTEYVVSAAEVSNAAPTFVAGPGYTNQLRFFANFAQVADKNTRTGLSGAQTATFDSGQVGATWASLILTFK